jgi:hypothetical protein
MIKSATFVTFVFILLCIVSIPLSVQAFSAEVMVDTGIENINALEATMHIPLGVSIDNMSSGNSAVLFWVTQPVHDNQLQSISFSGITPGGFRGQHMVFTISGNFSADDLTSFTFSEVQALKSDGVGSSANVEFSLKPTEILVDTLPPDNFQPLIGQNDEIFDGQYFLVFTTQDKGLGVDHYEVQEGYFGTFVNATSPYLLKYQSLNKKIYIKAYDKSGNKRVVVLEAKYPDKWYQYALFVIMLVSVISSILFKKPWLKFGT